MIAAATTTSSGFNPLSIFSILQYPFAWVLQQLVNVFTQVGPLKAIGASCLRPAGHSPVRSSPGSCSRV